jgi:hypothetical protein
MGLSKLYSEEISDMYIELNLCVYVGRGNRGVCKLHSEELNFLCIKLNICV